MTSPSGGEAGGQAGIDHGDVPGRPRRPPAPPLLGTPDAERYVLEADVMRRRQLRSALLHGSARTWREHRRTWPAVVVGIVVIAVALAAMAVVDAYQRQQEINEQREQDLGSQVVVPSYGLLASPPVTLR